MNNPFQPTAPVQKKRGMSAKTLDDFATAIAAAIDAEMTENVMPAIKLLEDRIAELEARPASDIDRHINQLEQAANEFEGKAQ